MVAFNELVPLINNTSQVPRIQILISRMTVLFSQGQYWSPSGTMYGSTFVLNIQNIQFFISSPLTGFSHSLQITAVTPDNCRIHGNQHIEISWNIIEAGTLTLACIFFTL
jgi:hypothetical protein